mmetsp:Transcript_32131/g.88636  ORF Transcript_32131/g.88636 Transcript_32131/m.88636 type:complete len:102 (-) Transcript_32131:212-517(-)
MAWPRAFPHIGLWLSVLFTLIAAERPLVHAQEEHSLRALSLRRHSKAAGSLATRCNDMCFLCLECCTCGNTADDCSTYWRCSDCKSKCGADSDCSVNYCPG